MKGHHFSKKEIEDIFKSNEIISFQNKLYKDIIEPNSVYLAQGRGTCDMKMAFGLLNIPLRPIFQLKCACNI